MKRTILYLLLVVVVLIAIASFTDPAAHGDQNQSWIYYVSHPYVAYRTYTVTPVVIYPRYYRPVYVAPVYPVYRMYPVYTYQYWYNLAAGTKAPEQAPQQGLQSSGVQAPPLNELR